MVEEVELPKEEAEEAEEEEEHKISDITLWRNPLATLYYFGWALAELLSNIFQWVKEHKLAIFLSVAGALLTYLLLSLDGPQQKYVGWFTKKLVWYGWWFVLGVLSSIGMGTGLHTFLLYLGPHIATVTMAAWECGSTDFPEPPYPATVLCPAEGQLVAVNLWLIIRKIQLESIVWHPLQAMTFTTRGDTIQDGDTIVIRRETGTLEPLVLKRNVELQLTAGLFRHNDMIGKPYGCRMFSHNRKCAITLLAPTPELWTMSLPHRTQILYSTDISYVCLMLEVVPGSVVVESGTGSGSLTHALARAVGQTGHVHTHEFHKERCEAAAREFTAHGLEHVITSYHKNVCVDGFAVKDLADAVFLDLPSPWEAIPHAVSALGPDGGRICSFSPCIEQVQRTCLSLEEHGFEETQTFEGIERPYQLSRKRIWEPYVGRERHKKYRSDQMASDKASKGWLNAFVKGGPKKDGVGHTGYLTFATLPAKELLAKKAGGETEVQSGS